MCLSCTYTHTSYKQKKAIKTIKKAIKRKKGVVNTLKDIVRQMELNDSLTQKGMSSAHTTTKKKRKEKFVR